MRAKQAKHVERLPIARLDEDTLTYIPEWVPVIERGPTETAVMHHGKRQVVHTHNLEFKED